MPPSQPIPIFFILALTSRDIRLYEKIHGSLQGLRRQGLIEVSSSNEVKPGSDSNQVIRYEMSQARIIVLLLTPDFSQSDQCVEVEMPYALEQQSHGKATVIPVLLRPTAWENLSIDGSRLLPENGKPVTRWGDRDAAFLHVTKGIQQIVDEVKDRLENPILQKELPPRSLRSLLRRPNPFFIDRKKILEALHLFFTERTTETRIQALYGVEGIGKTDLAIEYAKIHYDEYQAIFWLDASSAESLSSDILFLIEQLDIPAPNELNEQQRFNAIKEWLQQHDKWLVILDNLEAFSIVDPFIPHYSKGHVLVTAQSEQIEEVAQFISVEELSPEDGTLLLLRLAKPTLQWDLNASALETDVLQAREIAREFVGYPLALNLAGAYIRRSKQTFSSYLELYKENKAILLENGAQSTNSHTNPVKTTFSLTFSKIGSVNPLALKLLHLLAFLHSDALPDDVIMQGISSLDGPLRKLTTSSLTFNNTLATLQKFSLIQRSSDTTTLTMHRMLQLFVKNELKEQQQYRLAEQAVRLVNLIFPEVLFENWKKCQRYMSQAQHCATLIREFELNLQEGGFLLERLGFYCLQRGIYDQAETYLTGALQLYGRNKYIDVLHIAQAQNSLGLLYRQLARYKEAEEAHICALKLREQTLGQDDPKTMESLHNLAMVYGDLGKYQEAERYFLQVLTIEESAKGPDNTDVADTLNELALTYLEQGRFAEAEIAARRTLAIYEQAHDDAEHPDLTYPLDTLGRIEEKRGDYRQAEIFYQKALDICLYAFDEEHPETAHSKTRLAGIAVLQGNYEDAANLYQQALNIDEQQLGSNHPDVALVLNGQAVLATKQEQYERAEQLYKQALRIYKLAMGEEHPYVANVLNYLGELSRTMGNKEDAATLFQQALAIREKTFGSTHPSIAQGPHNLTQL
jgi:tetratricopeptide (TPR) repeat protein